MDNTVKIEDLQRGHVVVDSNGEERTVHQVVPKPLGFIRVFWDECDRYTEMPKGTEFTMSGLDWDLA